MFISYSGYEIRNTSMQYIQNVHSKTEKMSENNRIISHNKNSPCYKAVKIKNVKRIS